MKRTNRIEVRRAAAVSGLARWRGVFGGGIRLMVVLGLGMVSGCSSSISPYEYDFGSMFDYARGEIELPSDLPPDLVDEWNEYRAEWRQAQQGTGKDPMENRRVMAWTLAQLEYMRLPEGYSEPVQDARIPRSVLVTGDTSVDHAGSVPDQAGAAGQSAVAVAERSWDRFASSQPGIQGMKRYARIRAVHALLQGKVFRQIVPCGDTSSPLVTDDALLLHVELVHGAEWEQTEGGRARVPTEQWRGVLRDVGGRKAGFTIKVARHWEKPPVGQVEVEEAVRQFEARYFSGIVQALGPAIVKCYGEMR